MWYKEYHIIGSQVVLNLYGRRNSTTDKVYVILHRSHDVDNTLVKPRQKKVEVRKKLFSHILLKLRLLSEMYVLLEKVQVK